MACLGSLVTFSVPVSAAPRPTTFFKGRNLRKLALTRPLRQKSYRTATELSTSCNTTDATSIWNSRPRHLMPLRHQCIVVSCHLSVGSCTQMLISGYWVGPDNDDGWGFIEAFVKRI